jgi:hypothetical protein
MRDVDRRIADLEAGLAQETLILGPTVDEALRLASHMMLAFTQAAGRTAEGLDETADPLEIFKVFVKGDPSLNAIRDNVRELVYYRNCLAAGREDALPVRPVAMAVRAHAVVVGATEVIHPSMPSAPVRAGARCGRAASCSHPRPSRTSSTI